MQQYQVGSTPQEGTNVLVRTVTYHYVGRISALTDTYLTLTDAAWVADSGRFSTALATGFDSTAEIEMYPPTHAVWLILSNIVEITLWPHALPTVTQ